MAADLVGAVCGAVMFVAALGAAIVLTPFVFYGAVLLADAIP